jgi:hypothetical protein
MCHSINQAIKHFITREIPFNASIMFTCGWYHEIIDEIKNNPLVSPGIHLVLNSEWSNFKWGPVLGKSVPTIVNKEGFFHTSQEALINSHPSINEIEQELRAQIERAFSTGLDFYYLDSHMNILEMNDDLKELQDKLADEFDLLIPGRFQEEIMDLFYVPSENKIRKLITKIKEFEPGRTYYDLFHLGVDNEELQALVDMHMLEVGIDYDVSEHRQAELDALCSADFTAALKMYGVKVITYKDIKKGLKF